MKLSIVATLYNSSRYVDEFYRRSKQQAEQLCDAYEIVLVDDGSPDDSLQKAIKLSRMDPCVKVIELSRNHGHHRAMMVGLEQTQGDLIFLTDVDLEEAPENLGVFWERFHSGDHVDVVYGIQKEKATPLIRKQLSQSFYTVFNALSSVQISNRSLVSRLMTRDYVSALLTFREREIFLPALWEDTGFIQVPIEVDKSFNGNSTYTLAKRIKLSVNAITSYSSKPLAMIFYLGLGISAVSGLTVLMLIVRHWFLGQSVAGWASIVASVYLIGGLIIFSVGVIGIYLSRIFIEVKQRPYSIIRAIHEHKPHE